MEDQQLDSLMKKGIEAVEKDYIHSAQVFLGQVSEHRNTPELQSYLAYCQAKGQGQFHSAIKICRESIKRESTNPVHYLLLGRILLLSGDKGKAMDAWRQGLHAGPDSRIINELKKQGLRKPAVIKSLKRNHPVNRVLGKLLTVFGLR